VSAPLPLPPPPPLPAPPSRLPVSVDRARGTCTVFDRVILMPGQCLRQLDTLVAAYPQRPGVRRFPARGWRMGAAST